ncbi:AT-rich interactive domain-containing protein 2-like [Littorina saxatilis]|uniref:AT-rich interactive domain-containing protein 2 n=1 Tax=Littorina saxatilis TaxID=31220 RepID=A0AAN9BLW4_9CAEN
MANVLNKDPFTYAEDRRSFLQDLQRFHTSRGTPFDRIPQIAGREIDLYRLYRRVIDLGGWQKVNNDLLWEDIQEEFKIPVACTNGAQALKYIYFRYLNIYEKVNFLGVDPDSSRDDQEDGPARKKVCLPVESIPLTYNYNHHKIPDTQRAASKLSTDLARFSDYEKLEMSLRCGLPNEVDFAVNVCLLLSNEGRHVLKLNKSLHLLPLLMANIGIFDEGPGSMEDVMLHSWTLGESKRDFLRFWHDTVNDDAVRLSIFTRSGVYKREEMLGSEVLHLGRELGVKDPEGQRVTQLAMLIRNLSFEDVNQQLLASSPLVFRFLMLCVHNSYGSLRQLALDTLGNLAAQMVLQPVETTTTKTLVNLIKKSVVEEDKFVVVRGLEMVSKLCQVEKNEAILCECLEQDTYCSMVELLTVHDIQLIVHVLEALYQLSELGETTSNMIARVKNAVDLLVNLITVEAQSYGPNSLIGIKVVEYVPPPDVNAAPSSSATPQPSRTVIQSIAPGHSPGFPVQHSSHLSPAEQARADVETTASNWLQGTFEGKKGSCITQADLFADYQQFCRKFGVADSLSTSDFVTIVKSAIPHTTVTEVDKGGGEKEPVVRGVCRRAIPRPFAILAGSDRVYKPSGCSVPANSLRGPVPASWPLGSDPTVPTHTPTLRQRLMEPPRMSLQHQLVNYAGATGAGAPPSSRPPTPKAQPLAPKQPGGVKKRLLPATPPPAQPSGPGPGGAATGAMQPRPVLMANVIHHPRPVASLQQQFQVAGAPQVASSMIQPTNGDHHVTVQASTNPLLKPGPLPHSSTTLVPLSAPLTVAASAGMAAAHTSLSAAGTSPGQQFPLIHQALQGEGAPPGVKPAAGEQGNDTNLIKSLLAKKVCQNMVRQGTSTPSHSPPPHDLDPASMTDTQHHQPEQLTSTPNPSQPLVVQYQHQLSHQAQGQQPPNQAVMVNQQAIHGQPQVLQQQQLAPPQPGQPQVLSHAVQPAVQSQLQAHLQQPLGQQHQVQQAHMQQQPQQVQLQQLQQQQQVQVQHQQVQIQQQQHPQQVQLQAQQQQVQIQQHQQQGVGQHGQPQVLQAQPHLQQVLHLQQGQQVVLHQQQGQQQPQQIHIQPRVSGLQPQQIVLQTNAQHLRPQQQIILQQHQQHMVIQGQQGLQHILHQPVQQLHIQPSQQLQLQGHQGQPLRIQSQSQQPMVIQLPVYQLPHMAQSPMVAVCATSLPSSYVQTSTGTVMPYRAIIPHPSPSPSPSSLAGQVVQVSEAGQGVAVNTDQEGEQSVCADSARGSVRSQGVSALQSALTAPSQEGEGRTVASLPLKDSLAGKGVTPSVVPAAPPVQTLLSAGLHTSRAPISALSSLSSSTSSSTVLHHQAAASSLPSSQTSRPSNLVTSSSPMSITQAILSGQDLHKATGSSHPESHPPHTARDNGHVNGNNNLTMPGNKECNGLSEAGRADLLPQGGRGEVNGILGSPDSMSSMDLPPSPMEGVVRSHLPNGLAEANVGSMKESAAQRSKELLHSMAEKAGKLNGVVHHLENGDVKFKAEEWRVPQQGERVRSEHSDMEVNTDKKADMCQVNGLNSLGGGVGMKENHAANIPLPHRDREQVLLKQTSMEEVSLDSTDSKLVANGNRAGSDSVMGRPLFSPDGSHDSDLSCDSFASSLADSVSSDKHSMSLSKSSSTAPSPSPSSLFPEVPLVLAGTIPMAEAVNKRNKKKSAAAAAAKAKAEKAPSKSKKRKGAGNGASETPTPPPPATPIPMKYMCEWAGCRRCFNSARLVFIHVTKTHVPTLPESVCQWLGCEPLRRKRWSLVTHIQDHHCSEGAQRQACQRRFHAAQTAAASPHAPVTLQQAPALVYPPDAAMQAIKRFHIKPPFPEFAEQREGPVTKHIRLTSALILRNLARYSSHGRSLIKHCERQVSYVTMSAVESSTALAGCLWEILHDT